VELDDLLVIVDESDVRKLVWSVDEDGPRVRWTCRVTLGDGSVCGGRGRTPEDALRSAMRLAVRNPRFRRCA